MGALQHIRPFSFGARAARLSRQEFVESVGGRRLIVVALEGHPDALFNGLMECPTDEDGTWHPRSERTGAETKFHTVDGSGTSSLSAPSPISAQDLAGVLTAPHFVAPLRKRARAGMKDDERITVGRSSLNDIVLSHPSVSKLHAWLEYDDRERFFVCDAASTNKTRIQGEIVQPNDSVLIRLGEPLVFGKVVVRVCEAALLWDALNAD